MEDREFGLKGVAAAGAGAAAVVGGLGSVAAQDDDDVEVSAPGADDPTVSTGGITVGVVDGEASVDLGDDDDDDASEDDEVEEEADDDDAAEDDGSEDDETVEDDGGSVETTSTEISATPALAISDASGGDNNFAFVS